MARTRLREKGRREHGHYITIPTSILESREYAELSARAVKLMLDLYGQYRGFNNGDFTAAWAVLKYRGWSSKATLYKAIDELIGRGWIIRTRLGGRATLGANRICSLYAVTWKPIDYCGGKLEVAPTKKQSDAWKNAEATPPADRIGPQSVPMAGVVR
jgi:hypothetical protein